MDENFDFFALISWKLILGVVLLVGVKLLCLCRAIPECLAEQPGHIPHQHVTLTANDDTQETDDSTCAVTIEMQEQLKKELLEDCHQADTRETKISHSGKVPTIQNCGTCCICYEDYQGKLSDIRLGYLPHCQHFYHFDCIWQWLEKQGTCPLCRKETQLVADDIRAMSLKQVLQSHDSLCQDIHLDVTVPGRMSEISSSSETSCHSDSCQEYHGSVMHAMTVM